MSQSVPQDNSKNEALNPTIKRLGLVSFFTDVGSEMLYPITPIFLTSILGASMTSLGMIEGVAEGIASLLKTYSGAWSDRIKKRKLFIVIGIILATTHALLQTQNIKWDSVLKLPAFIGALGIALHIGGFNKFEKIKVMNMLSIFSE